jgi:integrase
LRLRVKDFDFGRGEIIVREGKGQKDRETMLPEALRQALQDHLRHVREQHEADLKGGLGRAPLPDALIRKTRMRTASGAGNGSFPLRPITLTEEQASGIATICTDRSYKRRSARRRIGQALPSA